VFLEPLGLSQRQAAALLAIPNRRLSGIVADRRGVTADVALRLERAFGMDAQVWLTMQVAYTSTTPCARPA